MTMITQIVWCHLILFDFCVDTLFEVCVDSPRTKSPGTLVLVVSLRMLIEMTTNEFSTCWESFQELVLFHQIKHEMYKGIHLV